MRVVLIDEARLDQMRDALLDKLKAGTSAPQDADAQVAYRAVHFYVHDFVDAIKKDK